MWRERSREAEAIIRAAEQLAAGKTRNALTTLLAATHAMPGVTDADRARWRRHSFPEMVNPGYRLALVPAAEAGRELAA